MYSLPQKLVKSLLSLAHSNAKFFWKGLRTVKDHVMVCGEPHKSEIANGLHRASRETQSLHCMPRMSKRNWQRNSKQTVKGQRNSEMPRNREKRSNEVVE